MSNQKGGPGTLWAFALAAVVVARVALYFLTPLLDNDSIVVFMGAREWAAGGALSMVNTLPVLIVGILYRLFGESIYLARLPQLLGGLGVLFLLYKAARSTDSRIGPLAAILFGLAPIALLYGSIAKPYSLMTFFVVAGAFAYHRSVVEKKNLLAGLAGLSFAMGFLCYTFAASAAFPLAFLFTAAIASKKYRRHFLPSLIAGLTFGAALLVVVFWRWEQFGWSIFNDYVTDWRFDIAGAIWSGRFVGLTDIWGVGIAVFVPGLLIVLHRPASIKALGPVGEYAALYSIVGVALWLCNPVNHFPRVLLPVLPFVALLIASAVFKVAKEGRIFGVSTAWAIASISSILVMYPRFRETNVPLWLFDPRTGRGVAATILAIGLVFLLALAVLHRLDSRFGKGAGLLFLVPAALSFCFGPVMAWQGNMAQAAVFQSRATLARIADVSSILGAGDYTAIGGMAPESVPWLMDLEVDELVQVLDGKIIDVCKKRGISHVIVEKGDPEGMLAMLAGLSAELGRDIRDIGRIYKPLFDPNVAWRIADNSYGVLYRIRHVRAHRWSGPQNELFKSYGPLIFPDPYSLWLVPDLSESTIWVYFWDSNEPKGARIEAYAIGQDKVEQLTSKPKPIGKGSSESFNISKLEGRQLTVNIVSGNGEIFRQASFKGPTTLKATKP